MAVRYYTYAQDAYNHMQEGQEVKFKSGSGYYLADNPPAKAPTPAASSPAGIAPTTTGTDAAQNGGGGGGGGDTPGAPTIDWEAALGDYGLPQDVIDELTRIWAVNYQNPNAFTIAQAYVRTTGWYAAKYPGIQQGINAGLFSNEQGYMAYTNTINQIYQQYYGRVATPAEVSQYVTSGMGVTQVANEFQAPAILGNISDPLKALFTPEELQAYANQQAGIDSQLGQKIVAQANLATQLQPLYQDFYGRAPTRQEIDQLTSAGTDAQTVAKQFATQDNINAMNPAVSTLFTPAEIQEIALEQAGGITQNGRQLNDLATLATQLNPIYHQYTGDGVSRAEVEQAYSSGTPVGDISKQLAGQAFIAANGQDIQQTEGSFGDTGQFTPEQLTALGSEQAGFDTPLGQIAAAAYNKAQQRLQGVFKGVLASPSLNLQSGRLAGPQKPPDIGA